MDAGIFFIKLIAVGRANRIIIEQRYYLYFYYVLVIERFAIEEI